jgi:hypothetical protein
VRPLPWLRVGAMMGGGDGELFAAEVVASAGPLDLGFVRRADRLAYAFAAPEGPERTIQRPALSYRIDQTRHSALLTARLATPLVEAFGAWDAIQQGDLQLEGALRPVPWLALRGRWESAVYSFDDWARSAGVPLARVDLEVRHARWSAGLDATLGAHAFFVRRGSTRIGTASSWEDNGRVTAKRLFSLDADFDLYLRHLLSGGFELWSVGWRVAGARWGFSAGAQHLDAHSASGGLVYGSSAAAFLSGRDEVRPAVAQVAAITAGVSCRTGPVTLRLSAAQLVPYEGGEVRKPTKHPLPDRPPDPPPKPGRPPPSRREQLREATRTFDGGRLVLVEAVRDF